MNPEELYAAVIADNPDLAGAPKEEVLNAYYQDFPEEKTVEQTKPSVMQNAKTEARGLVDTYMPKGLTDVTQLISSPGVYAMGKQATGDFLPQLAEMVANPENILGGIKQFVKHPIDTSVEGFKAQPLRGTAGAIAAVAGVPSLVRGVGSLAKGAVSKMAFPKGYTGELKPPSSVFAEVAGKNVLNKKEIPGLYRGLREPAKQAEIASQGYVGKRVQFGDGFRKQISAFEDANLGKQVDFTDVLSRPVFSQDPTLASIVNKSPKLKQLIEGVANGKPATATIKEFQDIKNSITTRINKNKFKGEYRPGDVEALEFVDDLNEVMLQGFPELKGLYGQFKPLKDALDSAKGLRTPESAFNFIANEANPVKIKSAVQILDPELANAIKWHKRVGSWGLPTKGGTFQIKAIAKNPWSYKQVSIDEFAKNAARAKIASRIKND